MHIYEKTPEGIQPRHFVEMTSKDGTRPTTLRDFKKWKKEGKSVFPSVTTILSILDKPALVNWKIEQHVNAVVKNIDRFKGQPASDVMKTARSLAREEMDKAPTAGTNVHEVLEDFMNGKLPTDEHEMLICNNVWESISAVTNHVIPEGKPEVYVASDEGYAGCVDLILDEWIIDYKTKLEAKKFKPGRMVYDEHKIQLAAYRKAINPQARCANVFVCIETGEVDFHEHSESELETGWGVFKHALEIWKLRNKIAA